MVGDDRAFTDGAGPPGNQESSFASAAGSAAISIQRDHQELATAASVAMSSVHGRQSVPRAETQGVLLAGKLSRAADKPSITVVTDASYVTYGMQQLATTPGNLTPMILTGTNGDLWLQVREEIGQHFAVEKVKAHLGLRTVADGQISWKSYLSNSVADAAAKAASQLAMVLEVVRRFASWRSAISFTTAMRIAATEWVHEQESTKVRGWNILLASASLDAAQAAEIQHSNMQAAVAHCTSSQVAGMYVLGAVYGATFRSGACGRGFA